MTGNRLSHSVAFYAPMKPPDAPTPSGDRRMARLLMQALELGGFAVSLASRMSSRDASANPIRQREIEDECAREREKLIRSMEADPPDFWVSYHNYYKAPDRIGPGVCAALDIPYVLVEASHTPSRLTGDWAEPAECAANAIAAADLILQPNPLDEEAVAPLLKTGARQVIFPPFLDPAPYIEAAAQWESHRRDIAERVGADPSTPWLACVAMMRADQKARSYAVLARALEKAQPDAELLIGGDGPARAEVERAFAGNPRVHYLGGIDEAEAAALYAASDLYVWPAIKEAYGFALLEAQAAGMPVLAGDRPGIAAMLDPGRTARLVPEGDADAFAAVLVEMLSDPMGLKEMGRSAAAFVREQRDIAAAGRTLKELLSEVAR